MAKEEKNKIPKNLERLDADNTLRRETRGVDTKKITPPSELGVVNNLRNAAKDGVAKAKEVGGQVVKKAKDIKSKAGEALKTLQNPTAAKEAMNERKAEREGKAYGGKVMKMAYGGKAMHKMPDGTMMKGASHKMGHGGKVKKMARGGSSASRRADGCAVKGKTKGRMV